MNVIHPINTAKNTPKTELKQPSDKNTTNSEKPNYIDPLSKWPIRGLAYSNELGVAIGEIAPKLGTLLWVPALMYFGADIYDKYKTQETNYNPSTKRALEQAIFQSLASVILPSTAVIIGQKAISQIDRLTKNHLSTNTKEATLEFILDYINKSKLSTYENDFTPYLNKFNTSLKTYIADISAIEHSKGFFRKTIGRIFSHKKSHSVANANQEKILEYAQSQLKKIIAIRTELLKNNKPKDINSQIYQKFLLIQEPFKSKFGESNYLHKAAKYAIKEQLKSQVFKLKMFKTIGGFLALGLLMHPIDYFVDKTIMKKMVEPNIDKLKNIQPKSFTFNQFLTKNQTK